MRAREKSTSELSNVKSTTRIFTRGEKRTGSFSRFISFLRIERWRREWKERGLVPKERHDRREDDEMIKKLVRHGCTFDDYCALTGVPIGYDPEKNLLLVRGFRDFFECSFCLGKNCNGKPLLTLLAPKVEGTRSAYIEHKHTGKQNPVIFANVWAPEGPCEDAELRDHLGNPIWLRSFRGLACSSCNGFGARCDITLHEAFYSTGVGGFQTRQMHRDMRKPQEKDFVERMRSLPGESLPGRGAGPLVDDSERASLHRGEWSKELVEQIRRRLHENLELLGLTPQTRSRQNGRTIWGVVLHHLHTLDLWTSRAVPVEKTAHSFQHVFYRRTLFVLEAGPPDPRRAGIARPAQAAPTSPEKDEEIFRRCQKAAAWAVRARAAAKAHHDAFKGDCVKITCMTRVTEGGSELVSAKY